MKNRNLLILLAMMSSYALHGQTTTPSERQRADISRLIEQYSLARENRDTVVLKEILTSDIDQLVSTGEWRTGIRAAVDGMLASSATRPGERKLTIQNIKLLGPNSAIVDCRYEIMNEDQTIRRMWSTFLVISGNGSWKISAIRNMLPSRP